MRQGAGRAPGQVSQGVARWLMEAAVRDEAARSWSCLCRVAYVRGRNKGGLLCQAGLVTKASAEASNAEGA